MSVTLNIYEEDLNEESVLDFSSRGLNQVPEIIENEDVCVSPSNSVEVLYLQNNELESLPDSIFNSLPNLMYLDLRNNKLTDLPKSIKTAQSLTHLLLQNNKITSLPNELGLVNNLKALQISGNPLMYPPREILNEGISSVKTFLHYKYIDSIFLATRSEMSDDTRSINETNQEQSLIQEAVSYNSVIDGEQRTKAMMVQMYEKDSSYDSDEEFYAKLKGKCRKLAKSRVINTPITQSEKYTRTPRIESRNMQENKIKQQYLKDLAIKKHKDMVATREKILQGRKNLETLKNWRKNYMMSKYDVNGAYKMEPKDYPYGTHLEFMNLLSRDDIEKDLPDKYKKKLLRRSRPTVPRKSNNDVHLALKIKQLFENLEAIDLNRKDMTPRTEQKTLMNEIQKISEIKQKLMELSTTNARSVSAD